MKLDDSNDAELREIFQKGDTPHETNQRIQKSIMGTVIRQVGFLKIGFLVIALSMAFFKTIGLLLKPRRGV
ncbi:hypothetical protein BVX98_07360 [bacterium F11]|nr:hypothetical protein BVX98_07360 [bacterium F11]